MGYRKTHTFFICPLSLVYLIGFICLGFVGFSVPIAAQTMSESISTIESSNVTVSSKERPTEAFTKCLTPFLKDDSLAMERFGTLFEEGLTLIATSKLLNERQQYLSKSRKFTIHYVTNGIDAVPNTDANEDGIPDFVEWAAEAADSSYQLQINELGYPDPIPTGTSYDIYLKDLSSYGAYGLTNTSRTGIFACGVNSTSTCIFSENDFAGFPPNDHPENQAKGALQVTIAHEFKHAIQYIQNNWQGETDQWAEMDATLMEEVVYDNVNDYYNYIDDFSTDLFTQAHRSLIPGSYEDVTFALYFHEIIGADFWPLSWELIAEDPQTTFLQAAQQVLKTKNKSWKPTLLQAYAFHYASGLNSIYPSFGFEESAFYPDPFITNTLTEFAIDLGSSVPDPVLDVQVEGKITGDLSRMSSRYYEVIVDDVPGSFVRIHSMVDDAAITVGVLTYLNDGTPLYQPLYNESTADSWIEYRLNSNWEDVQKLGIIVTNTHEQVNGYFELVLSDYTYGENIVVQQNYPNPASDRTTIELMLPSRTDLSIDIFDLLGRHTLTVFRGRANAGLQQFSINLSNLSAGTYIYRISAANQVSSKLMTVIR